MEAVDLTAVAQMELGLVIETIAGWLRTNEVAQRRWHELPEGERGVVDKPAVACEEQADMLARSTSLETLKVYGDALRGTLAVLTRVQAAHTDEVTVTWSDPDPEGVRPLRESVDVDGDDETSERISEIRALRAEVADLRAELDEALAEAREAGLLTPRSRLA